MITNSDNNNDIKLSFAAFVEFRCFKWGNLTPFTLLPEGIDFSLK